MKCERARRRHKEGGGTFNKLSRSESDKHQVSSVSGFHCESSKPEGSSLRRQLFHGVRAGLVFSRPSSFLGGFPAISNGENAKFTRRAAASWLEYSAEEKENRKKIAEVNVGVDSVKRTTASFSQLEDGNILLSGTILCVVQRNRRRLQGAEKLSKKKHDQWISLIRIGGELWG